MNTAAYLGNPNVYAVQQDDGAYYPVRNPIPGEVLTKHERGELTLGTYVLNIDKARFMVWDVDAQPNSDITTKEEALAKARDIVEAVAARGFWPGVLFSGSKGYHVWVLLDEWESGAAVQRVAKDIAADARFNGEVFPKQAVAKDLGNLVKVPGGVHRKTGQRSRWLASEPRPVSHELFEDTVARLPAVVERPMRAYKGKGRYPCMDSIITDPPVEGERNNLAYHFGAHLKRAGLWGEPLVAALEAAVDCSEIDVEALVERLAGPACDQLGADRHCPPGQCLKDEYGKPSASQLRNAPEGATVKVELTERRGNVVNLTHPDGAGKMVLTREE